jgi:hypothetical protein
MPATFHYVRGDYTLHLDFLFARTRLCGADPVAAAAVASQPGTLAR